LRIEGWDAEESAGLGVMRVALEEMLGCDSGRLDWVEVVGKAGSYLRRINFVYQSTLGLRVIKKKKRKKVTGRKARCGRCNVATVIGYPSRHKPLSVTQRITRDFLDSPE